MHTVFGQPEENPQAFAQNWGWQNASTDWKQLVASPDGKMLIWSQLISNQGGGVCQWAVKAADFTVLDRDIMVVPPARIPSTSCVLTVVGGEIVHSR